MRRFGGYAIAALFCASLLPSAYAGVGQIAAVVYQILDQLGITSGGSYTPPTLQAVTDAGATTTNDLTLDGCVVGGYGADGLKLTIDGNERVRFDTDGLSILDTSGNRPRLVTSSGDLRVLTPTNDSVAVIVSETGVEVTEELIVKAGTGASVARVTTSGLLVGVSAMNLRGGVTDLTDGAATEVCHVLLGNGDTASVTLHYSIECDDGTDYQGEAGTVQIQLWDLAAGVTASTPGVVAVQPTPTSGTFAAVVWSVDSTDDGSIEIKALADSSLTPTTLRCRWVAIYSGNVSVGAP